MRKTKAEMLSLIGQTMGIILSFQNVELKYEYLKATIDIFRDNNMSVLQQIKDIEKAYKLAEEDDFNDWHESTKEFDRLISELPEKVWVE